MGQEKTIHDTLEGARERTEKKVAEVKEAAHRALDATVNKENEPQSEDRGTDEEKR